MVHDGCTWVDSFQWAGGFQCVCDAQWRNDVQMIKDFQWVHVKRLMAVLHHFSKYPKLGTMSLALSSVLFLLFQSREVSFDSFRLLFDSLKFLCYGSVLCG